MGPQRTSFRFVFLQCNRLASRSFTMAYYLERFQRHPSVSVEIRCAEMQELKEETVESGGKFDDVNLVHLIYDCDKLFKKMLGRRNISLDSLPHTPKEKCSIYLIREAEDDRAIEELEECVNMRSTYPPNDPQMGW